MSYTPGVVINTTSKTKLLQDVNTGTAFIISSATWGKENEFLDYEGSSEISSLYKEGNLVDAANLFVLGGGRDINVYRFVPNDAVAADYDLQCSGVNEIKLLAKYKGSYGNDITFESLEFDTDKRSIIISDGKSREVYDNGGSGFDSNADIVTAIGSGVSGNSNFVDAVQTGSGALIGEYSATQLADGDDGAAITVSDISTIVTTYMDREYDFLLTPDLTADADHGIIGNLMESRYENYNIPSIAVVGIAQDEAYATTAARTATTIKGRLIKIAPGTFTLGSDTYDGGIAAGYYAGLLAKQPLGISLTHANYGLTSYVNESTDVQNYTPSQVEALIPKGFTVINKIGNYKGIKRAVTAITDTTDGLFEQVVRKEIDYVETNLRNILNPFIGQPNTDQKREEIKGVSSTFLNRAVTDNVINAYDIEVLLDGVDKVRINLEITPTYPINTITVNLTI